MKCTLFFMSFLLVKVLYCQDVKEIIYTYYSYYHYKTEMKLLYHDGISLFTFHKEKSTFKDENGWEFYNYDEYYQVLVDFAEGTVKVNRIEEKFPLTASWDLKDMQWEITEETKMINGYLAQKAITKSLDVTGLKDDMDAEKGYMGTPFYENAIAWFSPEIPVPSGPGFYQGLPGLIIELRYSNIKSVWFTLKQINDVPLQNKLTLDEPDGIAITRDQMFEPWTIDKKWLKQQKKLLKSGG
ncbi:MAG: GLPGLI family protein [Ekhidna sp.]|nr:GLPGLI family protein [Ekhidna sp.]